MTLKHDVLNGRALLAFLKSLNEEQLDAPVMVSGEKPDDTYFSSQVSFVAGKISIHVPTLSTRREYGRPTENTARHPIVEMQKQVQSMVSEAQTRDGFWGAGAASNGYVVAVDAEDLKRVFAMQQQVQSHAQGRGQGVGAIGLDVFANVCTPSANVQAIWYRSSMLLLMVQGPFSALLKDVGVSDKLFELAAKFPIKLIEPGVQYEGLPFDVEEFLRQLESI